MTDSRPSGTCAAPDHAPRRRHRHLRRGGAPRRPAQHHAALARRGRRRVRHALRRAAVRADRWRRPVRTIGSVGDGGTAAPRTRAIGPHAAGGDRHRHALFGPRRCGPAAHARSHRAGVRRQQPVSPATLRRCCCACSASPHARQCRLSCPRRHAGGAAATGGCAKCPPFPTTWHWPCSCVCADAGEAWKGCEPGASAMANPTRPVAILAAEAPPRARAVRLPGRPARPRRRTRQAATRRHVRPQRVRREPDAACSGRLVRAAPSARRAGRVHLRAGGHAHAGDGCRGHAAVARHVRRLPGRRVAAPSGEPQRDGRADPGDRRSRQRRYGRVSRTTIWPR